MNNLHALGLLEAELVADKYALAGCVDPKKADRLRIKIAMDRAFLNDRLRALRPY